MSFRLLSLLLVLSPLQIPTAPHAAAAEAPDEFESEIRQFAEADHRQPSSTPVVLFAGSSSFRLWTNLPAAFPGMTVLNRGFGGSTMQDLLRHFDPVVGARRPKAVVVYEGDNDLAKKRSLELIESQFAEFLDRMHRQLPGTPVLILAVKPSPSRRPLLDQQRELNERLRRLCASRPGVGFADTFAVVLDGAGEPDPSLFKPDRLHLNDQGYRVWTPVISKALKSLLEAPATP